MKKFAPLIMMLSASLMYSCGGGSSGSTNNPPVSTSVSSSSVVASSSSSAPSSQSSSASSASVQAGLYPNYNTSPLAADATGMTSTAMQISKKITLGINIGNTLEAFGCVPATETCWGNPKVTEAYVKAVKNAGFSLIRLPVSWDQYANQSTGKIDEIWLNRIKEVVQYCVDNDVYVMVNIHWDGGWLENNILKGKQAAIQAKQKAFWEQIATTLRDFDEHLILASANEPNVDSVEGLQELNIYHQTFIDAVRSTGGKNSYRTLVVQGPSTDMEKTNQWMHSLPVDSVADRTMVEVHFYSPSLFTIFDEDQSWGKYILYWGKDFHSTTDPTRNATWGEEGYVADTFNALKTKFVDKGIPVMMGEYSSGGLNKHATGDAAALHLDSKMYYLKFITSQAIASGLMPILWDTGSLISRSNNTVTDQRSLDALLQGAGLQK